MRPEQSLDRLGEEIEQLQLDFRRFFAGDLAIPPDELRNRIQGHIRKIRGQKLNRSVDRFRLTGLEARFNSYSEMFTRRVRELEEGAHRQSVAAPGAAAVAYNAQRGVVLSPGYEPAAAEALFSELGKQGGQPAKMDLLSFRTYLDRQLDVIRQRTGCREVQFRISVEKGKVKLKAKPVG